MYNNNDQEKYKTEVQEKWGHTPEFKEYSKKTKGYSKEKWLLVNEGLNSIFGQTAAAMKSGLTPDSAEAQKLVKSLQDYISENYYHCTGEILAGLGQMYVFDERFKNNIDKHVDGTADFISKAIEFYCGTV